MRIFLNILFLFTASLGCCAQGLQFQGNDYLIEERTSYSVFEKQMPYFQNCLDISFDISIHKLHDFGYIFRLKDKDTNLTYNFTFAGKDNRTSIFKFNSEGKNNLATIEIDNNLLENRQWLNILFSFSLADNTLIIRINNKEYSVKELGLTKRLYPHISFGKDEHVIDVPSFALRNLSINGEKMNYKFLFMESGGENVHNSDGTVIGEVKNPIWMINAAYYWKHRYTYKSESVAGVNFDRNNQRFLFFNNDSIVSLDIRNNSVEGRKYANTLPVNIELGTNFIGTGDKLYVYEVYKNQPQQTTIASLDIASNEWNTMSGKLLPMQLHHHTGYYDKENKKYIIFGGFGNQRYSKEFLSYDIESSRWDTLAFTGDKIEPRYFSGWAVNSQKQLLLFGGMGNESGDQTIGRRYYYDLYQIDLNSLTIKKLWDLEWKKDNIVPARNMVMLNDSGFYALCYPEHIANSVARLYKFSVSDGSYEIVGDSIPILSEKITTNANLYYNAALNELYCTIQEFEDDGSSVTKLYSISSPPIGKKELAAYAKQENNLFGLLWLLLIVPVTGVIFYYWKKSKTRTREPKHQSEKLLSKDLKGRKEDKANAIYLFGKFTVYDAKGKNITYMFSSRLERAFLLILLSSYNKGISSQQFSDALWPDRTEVNVKNLRGVTINHLRKVLSELQGIELVHEKGFFKIIVTGDCYCDYFQFMTLINSDNRTDKINESIEVLSRGKFLETAGSNLFGSFKKDIENIILSVLPIYIEKSYSQSNYQQTVLLSDILFITDPLNESALYFTITSLYKLEQEDEAKKRYVLYNTEYKKARGIEFPKSISSILKKMQL